MGSVQASVSGSSASSTGSTPEVQPLKTLQLNKTPLRQVADSNRVSSFLLVINLRYILSLVQKKCLNPDRSVFWPPPSLQGYLVPRLTARLRRRSSTCSPTWEETSSLLRPLKLPVPPTLPTLHIFQASQVRRQCPTLRQAWC